MRLREELSEQMRALQELKKWLLLMDSIFLSQQQMRKKHSNGYTSRILQRLKNKTGCNESWTYFYILRYLH